MHSPLHLHRMPLLMLLTPIYLVLRSPAVHALSLCPLSSFHCLVGPRSLLESCFGRASTRFFLQVLSYPPFQRYPALALSYVTRLSSLLVRSLHLLYPPLLDIRPSCSFFTTLTSDGGTRQAPFRPPLPRPLALSFIVLCDFTG
jgi:hypothetical protein